MILKGKVWVFSDNVDTDVITPGKYLDDPRELLKHVLEPLDKAFPGGVKPGDIMVAGKNFGCGSSRESAPEVLQQMKVGAIVAESFGRIFYRNSIAIGLPILEAPDVRSAFEKGNEAEVDIDNAQVKNVTSGKALTGKKLPPMLLEILNGGGQLNILRKELKEKAKAMREGK